MACETEIGVSVAVTATVLLCVFTCCALFVYFRCIFFLGNR